MPDLSVAFPTPDLEEAFLGVVDIEGKVIAALEDLGPVAGRDVILLDGGRGILGAAARRGWSAGHGRGFRRPARRCGGPRPAGRAADRRSGRGRRSLVGDGGSGLAISSPKPFGCCGHEVACCSSTTTAGTTSGGCGRTAATERWPGAGGEGRSWATSSGSV